MMMLASKKLVWKDRSPVRILMKRRSDLDDPPPPAFRRRWDLLATWPIELVLVPYITFTDDQLRRLNGARIVSLEVSAIAPSPYGVPALAQVLALPSAASHVEKVTLDGISMRVDDCSFIQLTHLRQVKLANMHDHGIAVIPDATLAHGTMMNVATILDWPIVSLASDAVTLAQFKLLFPEVGSAVPHLASHLNCLNVGLEGGFHAIPNVARNRYAQYASLTDLHLFDLTKSIEGGREMVIYMATSFPALEKLTIEFWYRKYNLDFVRDMIDGLVVKLKNGIFEALNVVIVFETLDADEEGYKSDEQLDVMLTRYQAQVRSSLRVQSSSIHINIRTRKEKK